VQPVFLDSAALVKLVVAEPETDALRLFLGAPRRIVIASALAVAEVGRAARRVGRVADALLDELELVPVTLDVMRRSVSIEPAELRTLDALQLASALEVSAVVEAFVAYDERLLEAAIAQGLPAASPR
jgi:uncharacterized protein